MFPPKKEKEDCFFKKMTHASMQEQEDSVECFGSGQDDADYPKTPKQDCFCSKERTSF